MKFAKYWEKIELPVEEKLFERSSISIWGASNESREDALKHAQSRVEDFQRVFKNGFSKSNEYEYSNGYIKEEVIEEIQSADGTTLGVLTRNYYGALVLNTEKVFFGDIDVPESNLISKILKFFGKPEKDKAYFIENIKTFQEANPQYMFRVYETCAGLRVVVVNQLFESNSTSANSLFKGLGGDLLYARLCRSQSCFRARLTPKPWRMGLMYLDPECRYPRNNKQAQDAFEKWSKEYELMSSKFGVVRWVDTFGSHKENADVMKILSVHDKVALNGQLDLA